MGLSSQLKDVSSDSIPILLVVTAAGWVAYLRSLLLFLLNSVGFLNETACGGGGRGDIVCGSNLAGLIALADHLNSNPSFSPDSLSPASSAASSNCVVCLCGLGEGTKRVRRLPCCHAFHTECLDGWFDQMNLSCPLCRLPIGCPDSSSAIHRRRGSNADAELVAWLCRY